MWASVGTREEQAPPLRWRFLLLKFLEESRETFFQKGFKWDKGKVLASSPHLNIAMGKGPHVDGSEVSVVIQITLDKPKLFS